MSGRARHVLRADEKLEWASTAGRSRSASQIARKANRLAGPVTVRKMTDEERARMVKRE